ATLLSHFRRPCEARDPGQATCVWPWIPASAGMTGGNGGNFSRRSAARLVRIVRLLVVFGRLAVLRRRRGVRWCRLRMGWRHGRGLRSALPALRRRRERYVLHRTLDLHRRWPRRRR